MNAESLNQPMTIIQDGYILDAETGEVLGMVDTKPEFIPETPDEVDWVLDKIGKAEAALSAVEGSPEVIRARAVIANAESIKKEAQRKLDWLHLRFDPDLKEFASKVLNGQKSRTYKSVYGSIAMRRVKESIRVKDESAAVEWAEKFSPDSIHVTRKFLISTLPDAFMQELKCSLLRDADYEPTKPCDDATDAAFEFQPEHETVKVTGGSK